MLVFAEHAWLGPGQLVDRLLLSSKSTDTFRLLSSDDPVPAEAICVQWLLPGFINAHCHLEYSWLKDALPRGPVPFGDWLQAIISRQAHTPDQQESKREAMDAAARELRQGGCTTVIDSSTDGSSAEVFDRYNLRCFIYYEVLGLSQERAQMFWERANSAMETADGDADWTRLGSGLNPHALYSVGPWLRSQLLGAQGNQAWHLSETPDEDLLFLSGEGSIASFLQRNSMPSPYTILPERTAFEFLESERLLENCAMVFHGNTLPLKNAVSFTAPRALVHCPSTHRWFQRSHVPLKTWLDAGVNVCLGTDSLASSDTLSMLEIVRMVLEDHSDLTADQVLEMSCLNPRKTGLLAEIPAVDYAADLTGTHAPLDFLALETSADTNDLREVLLSSSTCVVQVWTNGVQRL